MSLIDPRHLVAPLKNTVHLVTIIFIVLLFAVYRLSTGPAIVRQVPTGAQSVPAAAITPGVALPGSAPSQDLNSQVEKLLTGQGDKDQIKKDSGGTDASSLQDIEQALGLKK